MVIYGKYTAFCFVVFHLTSVFIAFSFVISSTILVVSKAFEHRTNKRFKTDSQRVAFVVCGKLSDLGGVQEHRIALLTT